jgi:integrase
MSLFKRGGTYTSFVYLHGVRHARALHTGNRRLAEQLDRQHKDELIERVFQHDDFNPAMTFAELCVRFFAEADVKPYHAGRARFLLAFFGEQEVGRITRNDAIRYRKQRHEQFLLGQTKPGRKLTETTVNRDLEVIRRMFFWAVDEGILEHNPLSRVPMVRERRKKQPVMSIEHEEKLLASASEHLRQIAAMALDTGMRRGELLQQLAEDIDFERRLISVTHSKTAGGEHRLIPLTRRLYTMLFPHQYRKGLLFTYDGHSIASLKTGWKAAIRRSGIPHYRFHDLRHSFNSRLVECGVIADVRKELMGHSSGGDIHSLYTHVQLPQLRDAILRLDAWHSAKLNNATTGREGKSLPAATHPNHEESPA